MKDSVRVVLVGDKGCGKSSLVNSLIVGGFQEKVAEVIQPVSIPQAVTPDNARMSIIDTSSAPSKTAERNEWAKRADVILLVFDLSSKDSFDRVQSYWMSELSKFGAHIILVANKLDLCESPSVEAFMELVNPLMAEYESIETCIQVSAKAMTNVAEMLYYAHKCVIHPTKPLFDVSHHKLRPLCEKALARIFRFFDQDRDGALNEVEINQFQKHVFKTPMQHSDLRGVKNVIRENCPEGINERGITLAGFLYLNQLFIERGRIETTWQVLRCFDYGDDVELEDADLPERDAADRSFELTDAAEKFLETIFRSADADQDGAVSIADLERLVFSHAPRTPFPSHWLGAVERSPAGHVTLNGFLSLWTMLALVEPVEAEKNLRYVMFSFEAGQGIQLCPRRKLDRRRKRLSRKTLQVVVVGAPGVGKTSFARQLAGLAMGEMPGSQRAPSDRECVYARRFDVDGASKTLVIFDVPSSKAPDALASAARMAQCDAVVVLYDASNPGGLDQAARIPEIIPQRLRVPLYFIGTHADVGTKVSAEAAAAALAAFPSGHSARQLSMLGGDVAAMADSFLDEISRPATSKSSSSGSTATIVTGVIVTAALAAAAVFLYRRHAAAQPSY